MQWRSRIDQAIDSGSLLFHCQPIFKIGIEIPYVFEVLVRLRESNGEIIPAARFINDVTPEQLKAIDRAAVVGTLEHLQHSTIPHAINLSGQSLNDLQFPSFMTEQLSKSGINPRLLYCEVTETEALMLPSTQVLSALRELRLPIGIDDFGVGYANIPAILAIEPDFLKVDGSIVRLMARDHWRECVVFGAMAIAHRRDIPIVLEHLESGAIEARAIALARHFPNLQLLVQGHLYGAATAGC